MVYRINFYNAEGELMFSKRYYTYRSIYYVKIVAKEHLKFTNATRFEILLES